MIKLELSKDQLEVILRWADTEFIEHGFGEFEEQLQEKLQDEVYLYEKRS